MRNNLFRSEEGKTRNLRLNNVHFGWKHIVLIWHREQDRIKKNLPRQTNVTVQTVCLDCFTMMNGRCVKDPFTHKAICEVISHLGIQFDVKLTRINDDISEW